MFNIVHYSYNATKSYCNFSNCFILVCDLVELVSVLVMWGVRWEYTLDTMSVVSLTKMIEAPKASVICHTGNRFNASL